LKAKMLLKTKHFLLCLAVVALAAASCSDDSVPLAPDILARSELAFFPLQEGYSAEYAFTYDYNYDYYNALYSTRHQYEGIFRLEVLDTRVKESTKNVFYRVRTTMFVQKEYYAHLPNWEGEAVVYTINDSTVTADYNLLLSGGSLWYVENAPSFERLDEGDTTLMMAGPIASGGALNLKLFSCLQGVVAISGTFPFSSAGDNGSYHLEYCGYPSRYVTVTTVRGKGIKNISFHEQQGGGAFFFYYSEIFSFTLIE